MAKSLLQDGDSVMVMLPNPEGGFILKPGFIFLHWNGHYNSMKIMTYNGCMNDDDSIGFWKLSKTAATRLVLTEKIMDKQGEENDKFFEKVHRFAVVHGLLDSYGHADWEAMDNCDFDFENFE